MVQRRPRQWNPGLAPAGWKQASEDLEGGRRVRKSEHHFVANPLDRRAEPAKRLADELLEKPEYGYGRRIAIDIRNGAEAREVDECDAGDRGLEAVTIAVRTHRWWP